MEAVKYTNFDFSNLNEDFYKFDRKSLIDFKPLEKRLSSNVINYDTIVDQQDFVKKAFEYLVRISYSLFGYVTKEKIPIINFSFEHTSSYCDLNSNLIVISVSLLLNETVPYQERVDCLVGLIFHEFFHKRFTVKSITESLSIKQKEYYNEEYQRNRNTFFKKHLTSKTLNHILNILEDYRIEKLGIKELPGYGFFFDKLRKYSFFLLSSRKITFNDKNIGLILLDFLAIKILMPELIEETLKIHLKYKMNLKATSFEDFQECIKSIEEYISSHEKEIYSDNFFTLIKCAKEIENLIPKTKLEKQLEQISEFDKTKDYLFKSNCKDKENNKNLSSKIKEELIEILEKVVKEVKENNSEIEKITKEKISNIHPIFSKYEYIKIHQEYEKSDFNLTFFNKAKKLSSDICRNLGFLNSRYNRINEEFELTEGELDEDELYSIRYNKNIFTTSNLQKGWDLDFGILLDESGSMYDLIEKAKLACLTLMMSIKDNDHINLYVYGHSANIINEIDDEEYYTVSLFKYYNTLEKYTNIKTIFSAHSRKNNADGFAIEKMGEIMSKRPSKNKILVVISDGQPNASLYGGNEAIKHTSEVVKKLEAKGFYVIQICMNYIEESPKMFTHYIPYSENRNFIKEFKKILSKKLKQFHKEV